MPNSGVLTADGVHLVPEGAWLMASTLVQAWGVSADRIERGRPAAEDAIRRQREELERNLAHFASANREVGTPMPGEQRVVCIGPDLVANWDLGTGFPGHSLVNRGLPGESTRQLRMRFHQDVVALKPAVAILLPGACPDFEPSRRMSLVDTESHLARIARLAKGSGIRLAIGCVTPPAPRSDATGEGRVRSVAATRALNDWIRGHCAENGYVYLDCFEPLADARGRMRPEFFGKGGNPNAAGYAALRPTLERVLVGLGP